MTHSCFRPRNIQDTEHRAAKRPVIELALVALNAGIEYTEYLLSDILIMSVQSHSRGFSSGNTLQMRNNHRLHPVSLVLKRAPMQNVAYWNSSKTSRFFDKNAIVCEVVGQSLDWRVSMGLAEILRPQSMCAKYRSGASPQFTHRCLVRRRAHVATRLKRDSIL
jgi:hypothetical protein